MPPPPSRYARPARPTRGLRLQRRDEAMLLALAEFRLLTSAHLHQLCCPSRTLRVAQGRLRLLWEHRLVDRVELPLRPGTIRHERVGPVYALSTKGAVLLAAREHPVDEGAAWGFPWRGVGPATLLHHIVVSDLFVALAVALRSCPGLELAVYPETWFRRRIEALRGSGRSPKGYVIPDGGFTVRDQTTGRARTYYVEVVRADIRGGTKELTHKLRRYVELNRVGTLTAAYRHDRLRAVLFLTTSPARAARLRALAATLAHGRRLFWFGSFRTAGPDGRLAPDLASATILAARFTDGDGAPVGLLDELTPPANLPRAPDGAASS